jgi:hypothetical protein
MAKQSRNYQDQTLDGEVAAPTDFAGNCITIQGSVIRIRDAGARSDQNEFRTFDLNDYWLPSTPFSPCAVAIASRPGIVEAFCNAARELDRRLDPKAKSNALRLSSNLRSWAKFFEYGWRNGLYELEDWTQDSCDQLLQKLGQGGWPGALELKARATELFKGRRRQSLLKLVKKSKALSYQYSLRLEIIRELGTNSQGGELTPVKALLLERLQLGGVDQIRDDSRRRREKRQSFAEGMGQSHLRSELAALNILGQMDCGLGFVPYPDTVALSNRHGVEGRRTANLDPDTIAALLKEAHWWLHKVSEPLCALLEEVRIAYAEKWATKQPICPDVVYSVLKKSANALVLEELLGQRISTIGVRTFDQTETSFKNIVYGFSSACFVIIAFLNARRKDEIQSKKIGIHRQSLKLFDATLNLFQYEVYIEKTFKAYVPFFVGSITCKAIRAMERVSDIARELETYMGSAPKKAPNDKEVKIFQLPRLRSGNRGGMQWFQFVAASGKTAHYFIERALGADVRLNIHPHMLRRAYALIFHYRYENYTLQAMAQQLGHTDLASAVIYISDRGLAEGESEARAFGVFTKEQIEANRREINLINKDVADVARDRIRQLADEVVAGRPRSKTRGQFVRLVQRFHQRLGHRIDYSQLDEAGKAKMLGDALVDRGHEFRPLPHANCAVSPLKKSRSAGCYSQRLNAIAPQNASPMTCTRCPYAHWVEGHNASIRQDIERLEAVVEAGEKTGTLAAEQARHELANLAAVLKLREESLQQRG